MKLVGVHPTLQVGPTPNFGEEGVEAVERERPDLVLMDIAMPKAQLNGIEACRELRQRFPDLPVVMFTAASEFGEWWRPYAEAVLAGAVGYVDKSAGKRALFRAIEGVRSGSPLLDPERKRAALSEWREVCGKQRLLRRLSQRESEVFALIQEGRTNQEIAEELTLSLGTVKNHVHSVLTKLEVTTQTQAASFGGS